MKKRALVLSGGGSKGAWAGGGLQYLIEEKGLDWNSYYGTSTGSLLITLTSLKEMSKLKEAYTNITQEKIFSFNPFTKKGNINIFKAVWRILNKKTSLGESNNLRKLLLTFFTKEEYDKVLKEKKKLCACVVNYTTGKVEYQSNLSNSYEEYIDFTWASTSVPVFTDIVKINGYEYLDGGVMEHVPLQKAIDDGAEEVDIFILRPEVAKEEKWKAKNLFQVLLRTVGLMEREVSYSDVLIGQLKAKENDVTLNFYYTPYNLTDNSLYFNKEQMEEWWRKGYNYLKTHTSKTIILKKS